MVRSSEEGHLISSVWCPEDSPKVPTRALIREYKKNLDDGEKFVNEIYIKDVIRRRPGLYSDYFKLASTTTTCHTASLSPMIPDPRLCSSRVFVSEGRSTISIPSLIRGAGPLRRATNRHPTCIRSKARPSPIPTRRSVHLAQGPAL
jgi:hypothetical protein